MSEPPRKRLVHGGLEHVLANASASTATDDAITAGAAAGNINISTSDADTYELTSSAKISLEKQALLLKQFQAKRMQTKVVVPVNDGQVKLDLRRLGHPVCLFGERAVDRRDRLRLLIAREEIDSEELKRMEAMRDASGGLVLSKDKSEIESGAQPMQQQQQQQKQTKVFYTPAAPELVASRAEIAQFSWKKSQERLNLQRQQGLSESEAIAFENNIVKTHKHVQSLGASASQFSGEGDAYRPLTCCAFSQDASVVATGSFDPVVRLWSGIDFECVAALEGHTERVHDLGFRPGCSFSRGGGGGSAISPEQDSSSDSSTVSLATASADRTVLLWSLDGVDVHPHTHRSSSSNSSATLTDTKSTDEMEVDSSNKPLNPAQEASGGDVNMQKNDDSSRVKTLRPRAALIGHAARLSRVAWHPDARHIATTSYDHTWRLWDATTQQQLLLQEGHVDPVYGLGFHPDGSLVGTGDLGGIGRVWDLRSGRHVYAMLGHALGILAVDFSPNGYHVATGSLDHTVRVHDLRKRDTLYVISGHALLVPQVKFAPQSGAFLATCSYDKTIKLWSTRDWSLIKHLSGHENKVMDIHLSENEEQLLSCSYDRTWKCWTSTSQTSTL